jgi:ribosome-binding protein aMBF1 (putative translation factor)
VISRGRTKEPQSLDVRVGSRIRLRRVEREMSQNDLADALSVTYEVLDQAMPARAERMSAFGKGCHHPG